MINKLYINGCSFTRGDSLKEEYTWPHLLADKIKPDTYINDSTNGNSFGSIFYTTITNLSRLTNLEDVFVVIGITWPPRYPVFFNKTIATISPADIHDSGTKTVFEDKYSTWRRMTSPYFKVWPTKDKEGDNAADQFHKIQKAEEDYNKTLTSYAKFYKNITRYDPNLKNNQNIALLTKVLALQSFFIANNISYRFIDFSGATSGSNGDEPTKVLIDRLNKKCILPLTAKYLEDKKYIDDSTSHPNAEGCSFIADRLFKIYNEL